MTFGDVCMHSRGRFSVLLVVEVVLIQVVVATVGGSSSNSINSLIGWQ